MAFTLKIKFNSWGKVYHYASMSYMGETGDKVNVIKSGNLYGCEKYEKVIIVGHEEGISPKATKWRTGAPVTESQRVQFPHKLIKEEGIMVKVSKQELHKACEVFIKLQQSSALDTIGFSTAGNIYYSTKGRQLISVEPNNWRLEELLLLVNEDPRKVALQNSLNELLAKAEEIKNQIEEL